jgi:acyl dehydratase
MVTFPNNIQEGFEISGSPKMVTSWRTWLHSGGWPISTGWPAKNIHTDLETAKSAHLKGRIASGTMSLGYLSELMIDLFGIGWLSGGEMSYKFIRPVFIGDTVIAKARVQSKQMVGSGVKFVLDIWCENQHGEKVTVGNATYVVLY